MRKKKTEPIPLKRGRMTYREIGLWRGVTEASAKKNFSRISKELEEYCKFERYKENGKYAGIEITEIYEEFYIKKTSKGYRQLEDYCLNVWIPQLQDGITTNTAVAFNYITDVKKPLLSKSTASVYASKIFKEHFGDGNKKKRGKSGFSEEVLGSSIDHCPYVLTAEQREIYFNLLEECVIKPKAERFKNIDREQLAKDFSRVEEKEKKGEEEVSEKDYKEVFNKQDDFNVRKAWSDFRKRFHAATGGWPIMGRKYDKVVIWDMEGVPD